MGLLQCTGIDIMSDDKEVKLKGALRAMVIVAFLVSVMVFEFMFWLYQD